MNRNKLAALIAGTALAAVAAGCDRTDNTTNGANSNRAVVVNSNNTNANTNANANANANTRASYNANITREEYDRDKARYEQEARGAGRTIGTGANDGWLWTKVRASLLAADDLRDSTIDVDVDNAVVSLSGTVANGNQKVRAAAVAKGVEGVKSVNNKLTIKSDGAAGANGNANANRAK